MSTKFWRYEDRIDPDSDDAFTPSEMDMIVGMVRESSFRDDESGHSIEERMVDFFEDCDPSWVGFQSQDGTCYVNCFGVLRNDDETVARLELQFELADDLESFTLSGMLVDDREQDETVIMDFEERIAGGD